MLTISVQTDRKGLSTAVHLSNHVFDTQFLMILVILTTFRPKCN